MKPTRLLTKGPVSPKLMEASRKLDEFIVQHKDELLDEMVSRVVRRYPVNPDAARAMVEEYNRNEYRICDDLGHAVRERLVFFGLIKDGPQQIPKGRT